MTITVAGPNAVSTWNEIASATVNVPGAATGTPEEQRPNYAADLATVHVAIYDAVMAIVGTHQPYAVIPPSAAADASQEAAVGSAAYRVLLGLFPARTAQYQAAYDGFIAAIADGPAKTKGIAIGAEAAAAILALRANDGRSVVLATYVPGTGPGQFRGLNPVNRNGPYIKPFALTSNAQFRAPAPPALTSAAYAADFNETRTLGSATSTTRTADQSQLALFGTSTPPLYWQVNMRTFATTNRSLAEHARLMAMVWVAHERLRQRLLRLEVLLREVASDFGDHARRHRRQLRDRSRCGVGPGRADAQPSGIPGSAQLHLGCHGGDPHRLLRNAEHHVRFRRRGPGNGNHAALHVDAGHDPGNPARAHRRRHALPHLDGRGRGPRPQRRAVDRGEQVQGTLSECGIGALPLGAWHPEIKTDRGIWMSNTWAVRAGVPTSSRQTTVRLIR